MVCATVDRFADAENAHCHRFNSHFYQPGTEAIDAFTQDWANKVNLLVPPIYLVPRVIRYLELCGAEGILFIPRWESAVFWPYIVRLLHPRSPAVIGIRYMGNIFRHGRNHASLFSSSHWRGSSMANWLNCV